jgi:hypothetical protein
VMFQVASAGQCRLCLGMLGGLYAALEGECEFILERIVCYFKLQNKSIAKNTGGGCEFQLANSNKDGSAEIREVSKRAEKSTAQLTDSDRYNMLTWPDQVSIAYDQY